METGPISTAGTNLPSAAGQTPTMGAVPLASIKQLAEAQAQMAELLRVDGVGEKIDVMA